MSNDSKRHRLSDSPERVKADAARADQVKGEQVAAKKTEDDKAAAAVAPPVEKKRSSKKKSASK